MYKYIMQQFPSLVMEMINIDSETRRTQTKPTGLYVYSVYGKLLNDWMIDDTCRCVVTLVEK